MIILDQPTCKIAAERSHDNWVKLTAFINRSEEWQAKTIALDPQTAIVLAQWILNEFPADLLEMRKHG